MHNKNKLTTCKLNTQSDKRNDPRRQFIPLVRSIQHTQICTTLHYYNNTTTGHSATSQQLRTMGHGLTTRQKQKKNSHESPARDTPSVPPTTGQLPARRRRRERIMPRHVTSNTCRFVLGPRWSPRVLRRGRSLALLFPGRYVGGASSALSMRFLRCDLPMLSSQCLRSTPSFDRQDRPQSVPVCCCWRRNRRTMRWQPAHRPAPSSPEARRGRSPGRRPT